MQLIRPSSVLLAATRRHPGLRRLVLGLALGDRAPAALRDHWVVQAVLEQESPDTTIRVRRQGFQVLMPAKFVESYLRRSWEPMTTTRLQRRLMPGTTFVDVGAHLGHYVLLAARAVGRSGRVIALEPAPHTYRLLRESVRANKLRHVTVLPVAAGSRHGRRAFHLADWSLCQGFYEHPYPFARPLRPTEVDVRPLDEVVPGPVDAVKVDVEGAELEVLEGMRRILAENPTLTLVVEWNPDCMIRAGRDPLDLPRVIGSYGFRLDTVLDAGAGLDRWPQPVAAEWVARMIQEHRLPPRWYGNLWAERGDSAS